MATIEDAGAARPTQIRVRIVEGRPFVSDFPYRLKSGAAWPTAPVLHFNGPSGVITWTSTLSDGGKLATVTATKAEVDTLLGHSPRGIAQLDDPSTGRLWAAGDYFEVGTAWAGGANPVALADGAVVVDDRLVIMGTGDGSGTITSIAWTEVTGKPSSYPPSTHSHTATDLTATGTRNATTYLRGDNTWATPAGGTTADATTTSKGIVELATTAETTAGTDATRAVTPAGVKAVIDALPTGGGVTVTDNPTAPTAGQSASYLVSSAVSWPAGLVWSTDPDGGTAPVITGLALVSMFTVGSVTRAVISATFAAPADITNPVWAATLTTGSPATTSVVVSASAMATDNSGTVTYERSLDSGATWAAITPSGTNFTLTGLTASTPYPAPRFRAKDPAGNYSTVLTAQAFTTASPPADSTPPTPGTLASSSITDSSFTLTVTGASDAGAGLHAQAYSFSTDNGSTWSAYQSSNVFPVTGRTASTAYQCQHRVRDAAAVPNVAAGAGITVTTSAATPTGFFDDFDRADGPLGASWETVTAGLPMAVSFTMAKGTISEGEHVARATYDAGSSDTFAQATWREGASNSVGVFTRMSASAHTGYAFLAAANALRLWRVIDGNYTQIGDMVSRMNTTPLTMRIEASGSTITGYIDNVQVIQVTDTSITSGTRSGIRITSNGAALDNFSCGAL